MMPQLNRAVFLFLLWSFCFAASLTGCAIKDRAKAITNAFLEDRDVTVTDSTLPFDHSWIDPKLPRGFYSKVYFRSVSTKKLPMDDWEKSMSAFITTQEDYSKEATELAAYFQQELINKVEQYPQGSFAVTSKPEERGLVFDISITELEFSHPIARAGALLAPVPGVDVAMSTISDPHVAFAARVYDGGNGKLIATLADRKHPPMRLLDLNKLTVTSSTREIVSIWAEMFAEGLNKDRFAKLESKGTFSLLPW